MQNFLRNMFGIYFSNMESIYDQHDNTQGRIVD